MASERVQKQIERLLDEAESAIESQAISSELDMRPLTERGLSPRKRLE